MVRQLHRNEGNSPMITTAHDMLRALRRREFAGVVLWRGASALDGAPIAVIATRITVKSRNAKTGRMVQTFVIRTDMHPVLATKNGGNKSVCGTCIHAPKPATETAPADLGTCYVNVGRSVASVYRTLIAGRYAEPGRDYDARILPDLFAGLVFRLGSYGDPTAAPFQVWRAATLKVAAKAGYIHQWRDKRFAAFKLLCMASADCERDHAEAAAAGWRTFRVRLETEALLANEIRCPASKEAGHRTTCASCKACGGTSAKAKASIAIIAHGTFANRFAAVQAQLQ